MNHLCGFYYYRCKISINDRQQSDNFLKKTFLHFFKKLKTETECHDKRFRNKKIHNKTEKFLDSDQFGMYISSQNSGIYYSLVGNGEKTFQIFLLVMRDQFVIFIFNALIDTIKVQLFEIPKCVWQDESIDVFALVVCFPAWFVGCHPQMINYE